LSRIKGVFPTASENPLTNAAHIFALWTLFIGILPEFVLILKYPAGVSLYLLMVIYKLPQIALFVKISS
jgi:hypothetical protein